ncbi:MAG: hypothetical protein IT354_12585, partial [Gemmatimonadaceae bacterium]|nr:hypothetical protein [Gemmatimonadaceae bacterium]
MHALIRSLGLIPLATCLIGPAVAGAQTAAASRTYPQLVRLFAEWRTFEAAPGSSGMPDYRPAATARRRVALTALQRRLQAIDTTGWRIPEQVDWHLVRAEMNGMQYQLTVLKPFARDPAFYASIKTDQSDTP